MRTSRAVKSVFCLWVVAAIGSCSAPPDEESLSLEAKGGPPRPGCQAQKTYCYEDVDGDGPIYLDDNCIWTYNPDQTDSDGDGRGDACDSCPTTVDSGADCDGDGIGDACDSSNAIWQQAATPTSSVCWVDLDRHFGYYTLEFKRFEILNDVSGCGSPTQYNYIKVDDEDCTTESKQDCCLRALPASTPMRENLCSHVDQNFCQSWPPPGPPPPPPSQCSNGGSLQTYFFCLTNPEPLGNPPPDCNQFEVEARACSYGEAKQLAQAHATNWTVHDGQCAACP